MNFNFFNILEVMTILSILYLKLSINMLNIKLSLKMVQLTEGYKERIIALSNIDYSNRRIAKELKINKD